MEIPRQEGPHTDRQTERKRLNPALDNLLRGSTGLPGAEAPAVDGPPPGGPESPPPAPLGLRRRPAARRVKPTAAALGRRSPAIVLDSDGEGEGVPPTHVCLPPPS